MLRIFSSRRSAAIFLLLSFGILCYAQEHPALRNFIRQPALRHAAVSFLAVDLASGGSLAEVNSETSLPPASCMKIITTATALGVYGPDYVFQTRLLHSSTVDNGVLHGSLYIEGSGDPTIGSDYFKSHDALKSMVEILRQKGIKRIEGDIVALDHVFGYDGISRKWLVEDVGNYYAPGIYGINIFDNTTSIILRSGAVGEPVEIVSINPEIAGLTFTNELAATDSDVNEAFVSGLPFSNNRRLYGSVPAFRQSFLLKGDIPDPGLLLARTLRRRIAAAGITVTGDATTRRIEILNAAKDGHAFTVPSNLTSLGTVASPSLAAIVRSTNVHSNNLFAEALRLRMTVADTMSVQRFWYDRGIDTTALTMHDGSGLSPQDAVSARFLVDVLVEMDSRADAVGRAFYNSLPVAGQEGTVASFMKNTPLAGKVRVKSGSISGVQSYAGYVETDGRRYAFALIIDNFSGNRRELRTAIGEFLNRLFE